MTFSIEFDYRFDTSGFTDNPSVRAVLEEAAAIWEDLIQDEFEDIPAGIAFDVSDPNGGPGFNRVVLDEPIDDVLIFVGGADFNGEALGLGGPSGTGLNGTLVGDVLGRRFEPDFRGDGPVTDVEYYVGSVTFATDINWNFGLGLPAPSQDDLLTTALHEIAHVLGFGTSAAFDAQMTGQTFAGPNALSVTDGRGIPLDRTLHVEDGFEGDMVLLDPTGTTGERKLPTEFDLAILADIGFEIDGFVTQGSQPPLATEGADVAIFGTNIGDFIDALGGNDQIQGDNGGDTLFGGAGADLIFGDNGADLLAGGGGGDQLQGGQGNDLFVPGSGITEIFGEAGADAYLIQPGAGFVSLFDFEFGRDTILIDPAFGLATDEDVLATAVREFTDTTELRLGGGTTVEVVHEVISNLNTIPVSIGDIEVLDGTVILGTGGDDPVLAGGTGDDTVNGFVGDDVLVGTGGSDLLEGGPGEDRAVYDGSSAGFVPTLASDGTVTVTKLTGGTDTLTDIERVDLEDGDYLYDLAGSGLEIGYRLYAAAFARTPDEGGLRFWVELLSDGFGTRNAALAFIDSGEFEVRYGANPSDEDYVEALYQNVLGRTAEGDPGGAFWLDAFQSGDLDRADMLIAFANAPENVAATAPLIDNGVFVTAPEVDLLI
ncbi:MAG: DUF4214 domain-containing protein [Pseudomonadota bacterium]